MDLEASGVQGLLCIIQHKVSVQVSLQRELMTKLSKMSITQEPGENVPNFNAKIKDPCDSIEQVQLHKI